MPEPTAAPRRLVPFAKMHGAGNDFVVIDATRMPFDLSPAQLMRLGDRRFGVGCDQVLVIEPAQPEDGAGVDFRYRIFNGADGQEVQHCGNGARCFVRYVSEHGLSPKRSIRVRTVNAVLQLDLQDDGRVRVDMGPPVFEPVRVPFDPAGQGALDTLADQPVAVLSMGNPHAVLRVADVDLAPVHRLGPAIQALPAFPEGVNVGFIEVQAPDRARIRVFERGAGETLACGTGTCAAVVAGIRAGWFGPAVEVQARGGALRIEWDGQDAVFMTGPAETVFEGQMAL